jgi:hypothetical protein
VWTGGEAEETATVCTGAQEKIEIRLREEKGALTENVRMLEEELDVFPHQALPWSFGSSI